MESTEYQNDRESINRIDYEINALKNILKVNEKYIEKLTNNLKDKQIEINSIESYQFKMNIANQSIICLEEKLAATEENSIKVNAQIEKLKRFDSMENELNSLRKEVASYKNHGMEPEIVENNMDTLESKLIKHELLETEAIQLQSNLAMSEERLIVLKAVCSDICATITENQCYSDYLHYYVDNVKNNKVKINCDKEELDSNVASLEFNMGKIENKLSKTVEQECGDLRDLTNAFKKELKVDGEKNINTIDMEALEKAIIGYKTRMAQSETDPCVLEDRNKRLIEENNALLNEKEELTNKCKQLEDKCTELSDQLNHRALTGNSNQCKTKALRSKLNPASVEFDDNRNELNKPKQGTKRTKKRVRQVSERRKKFKSQTE